MFSGGYSLWLNQLLKRELISWIMIKILICRSWEMNFWKFSRTFLRWLHLPRWLRFMIKQRNSLLFNLPKSDFGEIWKLVGCKMSSWKLAELNWTPKSQPTAWELQEEIRKTQDFLIFRPQGHIWSIRI